MTEQQELNMKEPEPPPIFCVNCLHHFPMGSHEHDECNVYREEKVSLVTGKNIFCRVAKCVSMRIAGLECGPEAKLFESKDGESSKQPKKSQQNPSKENPSK